MRFFIFDSHMADSLSQKKLLYTLKWIIRGRWIFFSGLTAGILAMRMYGVHLKVVMLGNPYIYPLLAFFISINFLLWLLYRFLLRSPRVGWTYFLSIAQIAVDEVLFSIIVYYSGGIESQAFMFYVWPIITSSVLFGAWAVMLTAFTVSCFYSGVIALEFYKIIPHISRYSFDTGIYGVADVTFTNAVAAMAMFLIVSIFCVFISSIIRDRERAVMEERDKVASVFKSFPDGLIMVDNFDKVVLINPVIEKILGIKLVKLLGRIAGKIHNQPELKLFDEIVRHPVRYNSQLGRFESFEFEIKSPNQVFLRVYTVFVHDAKGNVVGKMKILHNITREKTIDALKSEFISVAAHQLRTPLAAIKWVLQMILDGDLGSINEEQKNMLVKGVESNERMIRLVNDLLNVSRIEEGRFQYNFSVGVISDLVKSVIEELQPAIKERNIQFQLNFENHDLPPVRFDGSKLRLAIQNLIDNAIRYTPVGGSVSVVVGCNDEKSEVHIKVSDTGIGIPKNQQEKLFNKFFRGENVVRMQTEGTGLGLFIVRNIVLKHGGRITFTSTEGKGTQFVIWLPSHQVESPSNKKFDVFVNS